MNIEESIRAFGEQNDFTIKERCFGFAMEKNNVKVRVWVKGK